MDTRIIATLATRGITLAPPSTTSVSIGKEQAKAIAFQHFPNGTPGTAILANVVVQKNARYSCTCWVVSGPPGKVFANEFQSWMAYSVTFIDARSGKYEFEVGNQGPFVSGGWLIRPFGSRPLPK